MKVEKKIGRDKVEQLLQASEVAKFRLLQDYLNRIAGGEILKPSEYRTLNKLEAELKRGHGDEFLNYEGAAEFLGCSKRTLHLRIKKGEIRQEADGTFRKSHLQEVKMLDLPRKEDFVALATPAENEIIAGIAHKGVLARATPKKSPRLPIPGWVSEARMQAARSNDPVFPEHLVVSCIAHHHITALATFEQIVASPRVEDTVTTAQPQNVVVALAVVDEIASPRSGLIGHHHIAQVVK